LHIGSNCEASQILPSEPTAVGVDDALRVASLADQKRWLTDLVPRYPLVEEHCIRAIIRSMTNRTGLYSIDRPAEHRRSPIE
jgi:hypothetical protein